MVFEVGLRSVQEYSVLKEVLSSFPITQLSLIDKPGLVENTILARLIRRDFPQMDIILTFAIKNRYKGNLVNTYTNFQEYLEKGQQIGVYKFLIVSGNPKRKLETAQALSIYAVDILERYHDEGIHNGIELYCAYNPYFKGDKLEQENQHLEQKLFTGLVKGVFLQIGEDVNALTTGLNFIRSLSQDLPIYGCVLYPTDSILKSFSKRPWYGVMLSEEYLHNLDYAKQVTKKLLDWYHQHEIIPLVEIMPFQMNFLAEFFEFYAPN